MNKIVIIVILVGVLAIVVGCLADMGVTVYTANELEKNTKFPPWPAKCPDYWEVGPETENGPTCINKNRIGLCKNTPPDNQMCFDDAMFTGSKGIHYKCQWSKTCESPWEGVDSVC